MSTPDRAKECIVLIRRFIKPDRVDEFARFFAQQPTPTAEGFIAKWLTRPADASQLPPALSGFHVGGNPGCVTLIAVERWAAIDAFRAYVPHAGTADMDEFDALPRQRVILEME